MAVFKAQKIPKKEIKVDDILGRFCFYYQQYTYSQARKLPYKRIIQLLRVVEREHAKKMIDITRAIASPHGTNKNAANDLLKEFKSRLE